MVMGEEAEPFAIDLSESPQFCDVNRPFARFAFVDERMRDARSMNDACIGCR